MAATLQMTVNDYGVEWEDDDVNANIACSIGAACLKAPTRGFAKFYHHKPGTRQPRRPIDAKHCCMPCAAAECTRLGLQGAITVAVALMKTT
jgi:hypothetical protein